MKFLNLTKVIVATLLAANAFAQTGNGAGNGGGNDGEFKAIRNQIATWIDANVKISGALEQKLHITSMTGLEFQKAFSSAIERVGEKIIFNHDVIRFGSNVRTCKNEGETITCNIEEWIASGGPAKYMIVLHEYLGVAGLETNVLTNYSQYSISSNIGNFVQSKDTYELTMEPVAVARTKTLGCLGMYYCLITNKDNLEENDNSEVIWGVVGVSIFGGLIGALTDAGHQRLPGEGMLIGAAIPIAIAGTIAGTIAISDSIKKIKPKRMIKLIEQANSFYETGSFPGSFLLKIHHKVNKVTPISLPAFSKLIHDKNADMSLCGARSIWVKDIKNGVY